ncbi:DUF2867 domain-containing protein [Luteimonas salinilitoris]|uniref:DUF2867 domain-containing protein n=1 Tax=Luteimonas salinilitoris TaxID=3237697 RepID=A0ABV4HSQ6_9GAMM
MILGVYPTTDLADAYAIELPSSATEDPETLARFVFSQKSAVVAGLLAIRDALVGIFGIKTTRQLKSHEREDKSTRVGMFRIYSSGRSEIVLGEDDKHLDFRLSLMCCNQSQNTRRVVLSTVVHCHSRLGHIYIRLISPFHRVIVKSALRRAARMGWPQEAPSP